MFDFYNSFYSANHLGIEEVTEAVVWGLLTEEEFQEITGEVYEAGDVV